MDRNQGWTNRLLRRRLLARWCGWFGLANTGLMILLALNVLWVMPLPGFIPKMTFRGDFVDVMFIVMTFIGHFALLTYVALLPVLLLGLCWPSRRVVLILGVFAMTFAATFLSVDSLVYHLYHFHMWGVVSTVLKAGAFNQVFDFNPYEWMYASAGAVLLFIVEVFLALHVWRRILGARPEGAQHLARQIGMGLVAALFISYTMMLTSASFKTIYQAVSASRHMIVMDAQSFVFYDEMLSFFSEGWNDTTELEHNGAGFFRQPHQVAKPLNYPRHPLVCHPKSAPLNILVVGIDTLRYDMLTKNIMPHLTQFAHSAWQFNNNLSSGNCTRPGVFGLFYSIPPTYWTAAIEQSVGPVFIDELKKQQYQLGIFMSASMKFPAFNKTVFLDVPNKKITTKGDTPFDRDSAISKEFATFIKKRNPHKPFFSFLFYDGVHAYCENGLPKQYQVFKPIQKNCNRLSLTKKTIVSPYVNRYKNSARFDDAQFSTVLSILKKHHLLKNTVVIVTSDHGNSFNDYNEGLWGHAGAYVDPQVHTPMVVHWPGKKPAIYTHGTSHYDVVPTLMQGVLGCDDSIKNYSVGKSLLSSASQPFVISGSYVDYGVIEPQRITTIYPEGDTEITTRRGKAMPDARIHLPILQQAFALMRQYFK